MKKCTKRDERDVAFYVNGPKKGGGRKFGGGSGGRRNVTCHNCKKKGHFKADCWVKGGGMEGKGPRGKKGRGREDKGAAANVAEAEDLDDGVWAVVDEEGEFDDWEIADNSESDWAFLSDFDSDENEDLLAQSTIPDAHPADAEQLHSIMLESWDIREAYLQAPVMTTPSMPPLQAVSESEDSSASMPGLQSVSATEYLFDRNPSPDDEAASCSDSSIHILPDNGFASEPSMFDDLAEGNPPIETARCSYCPPHIPSTCCESKPFMFDSFDPITSSFAGAALAGTGAEARKRLVRLGCFATHDAIQGSAYQLHSYYLLSHHRR